MTTELLHEALTPLVVVLLSQVDPAPTTKLSLKMGSGPLGGLLCGHLQKEQQLILPYSIAVVLVTCPSK